MFLVRVLLAPHTNHIIFKLQVALKFRIEIHVLVLVKAGFRYTIVDIEVD